MKYSTIVQVAKVELSNCDPIAGVLEIGQFVYYLSFFFFVVLSLCYLIIIMKYWHN